jgi:hypothetical protein
MFRLPGFALKKSIVLKVGAGLLLFVGICCCYFSQSALSSSLAGLPLPTFHAPSPELVGVPIDRSFDQTGELGAPADFGYFTARNISRLCSVLSLIIMGAIAFARRKMAIRRIAVDDTSRQLKIARITAHWGVLAVLVPLFVHLAGTFAINNFGGLCGGGL